MQRFYRVSVVIPTYNYGRFLEHAVHSVMNQTHRPYQVIIVDDHSTDNTPDVVERLMEQYDAFDNIVYIRHAANVGQSMNRNAGIEAARGDLVALLDADDWWEPTYLEKVVAKFREDSTVGLVYVCKVEYDEANDEYIPYPCKPLKGDLTNQLFITNFVGTPLIFTKKIANLVPFEADLNEFNNLGADWWFALQASVYTRFACVDEPLYVYRQHGTQMSNNIERRLLADEGIQDRFLEQYPGAITKATIKYSRYYNALKRGYYLRGVRTLGSVLGYLKAIVRKPLDLDAYKGLVVTLTR